MLKLPFVQEPKQISEKIGNEDIGILEIPKLFGFTPNEEQFVKAALKEYPGIRQEAVKLAEAIAKASKMKVFDVYNAIVTSDAEFLSDHLKELISFQELTETRSNHRQLALATVALRRLVSEWSLEETQQLNPKLLKAVTDFAQNEENGWIQPEPEPPTEEDLGKSKKSRTGKKFSGESTATGEELTNDSAPAISDSSQSG